MNKRRIALWFTFLIVLGLGGLLAGICLGSVNIPLIEVASSLFGTGSDNSTHSSIVLEFRLPRTLTAALAGAALAVSGLMMQTVFRNPLADPFVLGVNSGASLGVAIALLVLGPGGIVLASQTPLSGSLLVVVAATIGAGASLGLILLLSSRVDVMSLLILGLMISYGVSSIVSILIYHSMADRLQVFFNWSFGSFGAVTLRQLGLFCLVVLLGLVGSVLLVKRLDAFLLGERYAKTLGLNVGVSRLAILGCASLLAGVVTGFCGPIGFIGIAAPHICRYLFRTSEHWILLPGAILMGGLVGLVADILARAPGLEATLPLNSVTALIGVPVIVAALLKQRNYQRIFGE
jgi:iron complex transport system permease protein